MNARMEERKNPDGVINNSSPESLKRKPLEEMTEEEKLQRVQEIRLESR